jgi:hypothetical protein
MEEPQNFMVQIPTVALDHLMENLDTSSLNFDHNDSSLTEFIPNCFAVRLKDNFLPIYLHNDFE